MTMKWSLPTKPLSAVAPQTPPAIGVLLYDESIDVDAILASAVRRLRADGIHTGGVLQRFGERLPNGKRSMWLEDVMTGTILRLDRPRGSGAVACILDPDALAQAACLLQRAIAARVPLLVVSRFGNAEADGRGLRAEIAEAACSGIVVVTAVRVPLLDDFEGFLGAPAHLLLPEPTAVAAWAETAVAAAAARRAPPCGG